jgi:eukaryotic-like serine/threonine-protein kinase
VTSRWIARPKLLLLITRHSSLTTVFMTPERWQQVDKLLERALEEKPDRRAAFLDEACNGDVALRQEVESLLSAHGKAEGFTEAGPMRKAVKGTSVEAVQPLIGQQVGHYQILSRLGEGGMGIVYKARDQHLDRFVAIKVLPPGLVADPDRKRRFVQEAKAASALNHPNIITIHDITNDNATDFIVMEYIQGKTLGQVIPRRGLNLNEVLKYAIQIADALAKAHAAGIVHRDLKPGNIMVSDEGLVKLLDFGLAKLFERSKIGDAESTGTLQPQTEEGTIVGTASYMSPEQAAGKPVDARSDIFSFGSVLYEIVTGQRAFQGDSKMSTLAAILKQEPKPAREIVRTLPQDLEKIITRCLRKEPSRRWHSIADVKVALEDLKEESNSGLLGRTAGSSRTPKRVSPLQWTAAVVLVILLATAAWFWRSQSDTPQSEGPLSAVPLTAYPGWELSPSFSPDGKQVAFTQAETGPYLESHVRQNVDIYIKQIGVEEAFRLTDHPAPDLNPAWSPDGQTIAFARQLSPERIAYITKPQRGGPERTIAEFTGPHGAAGLELFYWTAPSCTWTADSKGLVVVGMSAERVGTLFLVLLETGEKRRLTDPPAGLGDADPAISPSGRDLVFSRMDSGGRGNLCHLSLSRDLTPLGKPEKLAVDDPVNRHPAWTPDGSEIVYAAGTGWSLDRSLSRLGLSRSAKPVRLAISGDSVSPAISRQGNRLAYEVRRRDANIWRVEVAGSGAKHKEAMKFISSTRSELEPRFSPDGKKIAFASSRSGPSEIWVCNSDGSQPFQLTSFGDSPTNRPRWSPDGSRITFYSDASGSRDVYVINAEGGGLSQLTRDPSIDTNPDWSADGKWVYFQSNRSGNKRVWKVSVAGGEAVPVGEISESSPVESPDGKFLYYDKGWPETYGIWRVPTSGGAEELFVDLLHPTGGWVVLEDGIYYISKPNEKGVSHIWFKDFATGSDRVVVPIERKVWWGLTVSPNRRTLLYSLSDESGSDLMLVENFR